jgi:hypothetical protein
MWSSGDVIAARNIWHGRVRGASPAFVVDDSPDRLVFWVPIRSPYKGPNPRGVPTEWELIDGTWVDSGLVVHRHGESWLATHVRPVGRAAWWYVDVADSFRRTACTFDYRDLLLDVATDDGVRRLDEDELAEAVELGVLSRDEAREAERVAARVIRLIERRDPPFDGEWESWEPPASWGIPSLPDRWNEV